MASLNPVPPSSDRLSSNIRTDQGSGCILEMGEVAADSTFLHRIQDPEACDQMYESLSRLNSNYYREKYPRLQDTSFTEITADEYQMVLATDTLKQMDEIKKGMWKRLKDKFNVKSPQDEVKE
ncbi:ubiquinol-cytochrome c reductase complex assembly factor 2 isoform X2 [Rhinoderma darwinii]|uniref:ubiquinol-cytochrome c reductase complex assembly factor 2 isoform X2 n=1 Tax=Rhinoderma darwinii TaxID=43563 RepID=UPI003F67E619